MPITPTRQSHSFGLGCSWRVMPPVHWVMLVLFWGACPLGCEQQGGNLGLAQADLILPELTHPNKALGAVPQLLHPRCTPILSPDHFIPSASLPSGGEQPPLCSHSPWRPHHRDPRHQCPLTAVCQSMQGSSPVCGSGPSMPTDSGEWLPEWRDEPWHHSRHHPGSRVELMLVQRSRPSRLCGQCLERKGRCPHGGGHGSAPPTPFRGTKGKRAPRMSSEGRAGRGSPCPTLQGREDGHLTLGTCLWLGQTQPSLRLVHLDSE